MDISSTKNNTIYSRCFYYLYGQIYRTWWESRHSPISSFSSRNSQRNMNTLKYHNLKQRYNHMIFLTIGYNKIYYNLNNFITDSSRTSYSMKILITFSHFLLKLLRFNYQLLWEQQDQNAYINFPQVLTESELLPFINDDKNKHVHYRDRTSFNIKPFYLIIFDYSIIVERSELSDSI